MIYYTWGSQWNSSSYFLWYLSPYLRILCFYCYFFSLWRHRVVCGLWVPWPRIERWAMAVKSWSPNHWTTSELPRALSQSVTLRHSTLPLTGEYLTLPHCTSITSPTSPQHSVITWIKNWGWINSIYITMTVQVSLTAEPGEHYLAQFLCRLQYT